MDTKLKRLIDKATWENPTHDDLAHLASIARDPKLKYLSRVLYALGRAGAIEYIDIFERYLYFPEDSMISGMALRCLCIYLSKSLEYRRFIEQYINHADWDEDEVLRADAIRCAGELLRQGDNDLVSHALLSFLYSPSESSFVREMTFAAICSSLGMSGAESERFERAFESTGIPDNGIVDAFKRKFKVQLRH